MATTKKLPQLVDERVLQSTEQQISKGALKSAMYIGPYTPVGYGMLLYVKHSGRAE